MKKSVLLLLPVMAFATPAQAQDADSRSGFRIELVGLVDDIDANLGEDSDQFNPQRDRDVDGAFGVGVGFDFLRGPGFGAGVDLEVTQSTSRQNIIVDDSSVGAVNFENDIYVGGRMTFPLSGRFSVVGKLGYTSLKTDVDFTDEDIDPEDDNDFLDDDQRLSGVRAGIGVHINGSDDDESNTYYGVEYRYSNYEQSVVRHQFGLVAGVRF